MKPPARLFLASLLAIMGLIWIGQGLGYIGGSFMSRDPKWAAIGAVVVGVAAVLVFTGRRPKS